MGVFAQFQPNRGRNAESVAEMAGHVALIGEAGSRCRLGQRRAAADKTHRQFEPPVGQVAVRRNAVKSPERARDGEAVEAVFAFQFVHADAVDGGRKQMLSDAPDPVRSDIVSMRRRVTGEAPKSVREGGQEIGPAKLVQDMRRETVGGV